MRILIVEDEVIIAMELAHVLKGAGHDVVGLVATGEDAIATAAATRPDLVLMDVQLRGPMDGMTSARTIFERLGLRSIVLTAHGGRMADSAGSGVVRCIHKPFQHEALLMAIATALEVD